MTNEAPFSTFLRSLKYCGITSRLVPLVVRHDRPREERRRAQPLALRLVDDEPLVHVGEDAQEPDGVDVEDGARKPPVAGGRVVAGEGEDVLEPERGEVPGATLQGVAVPVLAGEMDDHLLPRSGELDADHVG